MSAQLTNVKTKELSSESVQSPNATSAPPAPPPLPKPVPCVISVKKKMLISDSLFDDNFAISLPSFEAAFNNRRHSLASVVLPTPQIGSSFVAPPPLPPPLPRLPPPPPGTSRNDPPTQKNDETSNLNIEELNTYLLLKRKLQKRKNFWPLRNAQYP